MTKIFRVEIIIRHRVPNIRLVGPNHPHHNLPTDFVVDYIRVSMMRKGSSASTVVNQGMHLETVQWPRLILG